MNEIVRGISIDNGGSECRVLEDGCSLASMLTFPNDFMTIAESDFREKDVEEPKNVCVFREAPKKEYLGIIANGLTGRAYNFTSLMLTSQENKTSNTDYYRQFLFVVARDALEVVLNTQEPVVVQKGLFRKREELGYEPLHINYAIGTCIPIKEHSGNKECANILRSAIAGDYVVEFPLLSGKPVVRFTIHSKYVGVVPEGGVAIAGLSGKVDKEDFTLIIDMGHVSTDIAVFKGAKAYGRVESSAYAGSMLVGDVRATLEEEGYRLSDEQTRRVLETGVVKNGKNDVYVGAVLDKCRGEFVNNFLKKEILQCLTRNTLNAKNIQNVLMLGAPMKQTGHGSVRQAVIDKCGLGSARVLELPIDPRYVNIKMTDIFTHKLTQAAIKEFMTVEE